MIVTGENGITIQVDKVENDILFFKESGTSYKGQLVCVTLPAVNSGDEELEHELTYSVSLKRDNEEQEIVIFIGNLNEN